MTTVSGQKPHPAREACGQPAPKDLQGRTMGASDPSFLLAIRDCSLSFGGLKAVDGFSLDLRKGEIVGLIGPNGSGKTTLFNIISGIYTPDSGAILFKSRPIHGLPSHRVSRLGIARTFQNIRLFGDLSVLDNVRVALGSRTRSGLWRAVARSPIYLEEEDEILARAEELLSLVGLRDEGPLRSRSLPFGDQRRLEIARAIATGPDLLLLDEPAAGTNLSEKDDLMALIRRIHVELGVTVLLIEHDMKVVMGICPRIVVLDHGVTIAEGTPEAIRVNPKVIEAYLGEEGHGDEAAWAVAGSGGSEASRPSGEEGRHGNGTA